LLLLIGRPQKKGGGEEEGRGQLAAIPISMIIGEKRGREEKKEEEAL